MGILQGEECNLQVERIDLADIFGRFFPDYAKAYGLSSEQRKVVRAIQSCRTADMGWHEYECDACGHVEYVYNGCHNRHCPRCPSVRQTEWVAKLKRDLLPVDYYHVVFTLPDELGPLMMYNRAVMYNLLFRAAWETLEAFGKDPKWLGGKLGVVAMLHTWGQTLNYHVHLHCLVTGGVLQADGTWTYPKSAGYLFPVQAVSRVYRGKYLARLEKLWRKGKLVLPAGPGQLETEGGWRQYVDGLSERKFFVYMKAPMGHGRHVVEYLGRYVSRVGISSGRLLGMDEEQVRFGYRDNRDAKEPGKRKVMKLSGVEFIRRFLWHVVPKGFQRIRYYGLMSRAERGRDLKRARAALGESQAEVPPTDEVEELETCPKCQMGHLHALRWVPPVGRKGRQVELKLRRLDSG